MGYCVSISESTFNFNGDKSEQLIKIIKDFTKNYKDNLRWIDDEEVFNSETIEDIFDAYRLVIHKNEDDTYTIDYMSGEKLGGYEDEFYDAIAPYVNDSYIEYLGEDGDKWRYVFKDGKCEIKEPNISWE